MVYEQDLSEYRLVLISQLTLVLVCISPPPLHAILAAQNNGGSRVYMQCLDQMISDWNDLTRNMRL